MKEISPKVKAKKHLGQHFLNDKNVAKNIADTLGFSAYQKVLEIGPGMGVLTQFLLEKPADLYVVELDKESVVYLENHFERLKNKIISGDFLKLNLKELFGGENFAIIGNFPYNISSQIVFKMLENKDLIPEFAGMFQKEVAERICQKKGSKTYGILSVLVQAFYDAEYLFSVPANVFSPPPKVESGVLRLKRKQDFSIPCPEDLFFNVVKSAFNQRRKTLRNSLKSFNFDDDFKENKIFELRPEQLSVEDFILITQKIKPV